MAQSVVYADLKFAAGPSTVSDEDDSPYENVPLGPLAAEPSPGGKPAAVPGRARAGDHGLMMPAGAPLLQGAGSDWQVSRSLQDTSREHMAEQGRLSQELRAREQSLEQTQVELAWAREELQRAWHEYNITEMELESRNAELGHTQQKLVVLQREMQEVQGKLSISESTVRSLRSCVNTDCCPRGWVLYRSKCLYISVTNKTWEDSQQDCARRSAQLLVQDDWPSLIVPVQSRGAVVPQEAGGAPRGQLKQLSVEVPGWHHEPWVPNWQQRDLCGQTSNTPCKCKSPWHKHLPFCHTRKVLFCSCDTPQ
uniref:CD72 protein n=1 Tax=Cyanistes caeruleus TaxID=156563 RepID=A0A8C0U0D6_CYACU